MASLNSLQFGGYDPYDDVAICEEHDSDDSFPCFEDTDYQWEYQIVGEAGDEIALAPACATKLPDSTEDELPF